MTLDDEARAELAQLEAAHRLRGERVVTGRQGPRVLLDGREVINLASNDYLGLAGDSRIVQATRAALEDSGVGAGASRLIVGNHRHHVELEHQVADWMRCTGVRTFSSGYAANVGVMTTLLGPGDVVFSDELNHASLIDGCRLSRAEIVVIPHRDLAALERGLSARIGRRRLVISESLFSMDGDIADVAALGELCRRYEAALVVDEAHAVGVFGPEGRGIAASAGVVPDVVIGTFGKALGTGGAFVATTRAIADLLWNRARSFVFSTGTPPAIAAGTTAALAIVRSVEGEARRARLEARSRQLRSGSSRISGDLRSPIAPVLVGDDRRAMAISAALLDAGVFAQGIRPPTVPEGSARVRMSLSADHTPEDIDKSMSLLDNALRCVA
ncbi:MAG: 8-amino-7-oxononanoate synthase [Deltaproteobacteria bacterium]|nr:8-amino-7-oxononanoate synthase [Deltaproteobacteria bacterium]